MNKLSIIKISAFFIIIFISVSSLYSQNQKTSYEVYFKGGIAVFEDNISGIKDNSFIKEPEVYGDRVYRYIQFYDIPSQEERKLIESLGIRLLEYIPKNVYVASIPLEFNFTELKNLNTRSLIEIPIKDKIESRLIDRDFPDWIINGDKVRVLAHFYSDISDTDFSREIASMQVSVREITGKTKVAIVELEPNVLKTLASQPYIRYITYESRPAEPESDDGRNLHRSNAMDVDYFGGYDFDGTGVSVAINDDGFVGPHIDFKGRADQTNVANDLTGGHGDMTVGIVGAAGNLDPSMRGMAPGAFLWVRSIGGAFSNTLPLHQNNDVMVFSTSYSNGCNAGYTTLTQQVDEEIYDNPNLIQVFSAGNSNYNDCNYGAGDQWGNITGGHKMGKNVIATANLDNSDILAGSSSRGPANDGRIKPDISAHGAGHYSTVANNTYAPGGGTSAAAPGIAGVLTQLHQAYREFNNGDNAPSALLKASVLNTANDLGNPGPDFKFGWGKVNGYKAMKTLEDERYIFDSVSNGNVDTHTLTVPAGVSEMRVMVYWHDVEASITASYALVNNLDMRITDPSSNLHQPLVLDHTPNPVTLNNNAIPGNDSINNVEQIRISNPSIGNYTITITGTAIPQGPQTYFVVYEYIYNDIMVTYPVGGEGLIPGTTERIHWDAIGNTGNFTAEYSTDGSTWTTISNTIPGDARFVDFPIPNIDSKAKVRISRNSVSDESDEYFSIIETPSNIVINSICSGTNTIQISWDAVPSATSYDVFYLGEMYMDSVTTTTSLTQTFAVIDISQDHWVSVRARGVNGIVGRRAIAIKADGSNCYLDCISDDDAGISSLISPELINESCAGSIFDVSVNLTNIGPNNQTGFNIYYQVDNNTVVVDTFVGILPGGGLELFTFSQPIIATSQGAINLKVWTGLVDDGALCNDTIETIISFYDPIAGFPYFEDFQSNTFPPLTMEIENPDGQDTWEQISVTGSNGNSTQAAFVNNFSYNNQGSEDYINILTFDLANTNYAVLEFDVAYTPYSNSYSDGLRVDLSTDCGQTYTQIYLKEGDSLSTIGTQTASSWSPSAATDWRRDTVDLSAYIGGTAKVRFVNLNGWGNNLYLDNIGVETTNQNSYCIPTSNCSVGDRIDDFSLNTINQTSTGCGTDGYTNYLAYSTNLQLGGTYPVTVSTSYSNQYVSIWIDFNNDTIFDNITERVLFDLNLVNTGTLYTDNITIPANVSLGNHRMRVRCRWNATCNDPCINFTYGETHDYTVYLVNPLPMVVSLGGDISVCEGSSYDIYPNLAGGLPPYSYSWSTGETTEFITVWPTLTTNYSVTITDSNTDIATDDISISINPLPVVNLGQDITILPGFSAQLDAGVGFSSYNWNTGETTQFVNVIDSGNYIVTVTDINYCSNYDDINVIVLPSVGPGWNYNITGSNHTILIPSNANITIDGSSIELGDYVGVFYDSLGFEACGGYMVWMATSTNVTAWGEDIGNDGFASGEDFVWKVWKFSTNTEYTVEATYIQPPIMPNTGQYTTNGLSGIISLEYTQPTHGWTYLLTGSNHSILVPNTINILITGNQINSGDYLGVFYDSLGTIACAGYSEYTGNTMAVSAWGEDIGNDGFVANEEFVWMVWDASEDTILQIYAEYNQAFPNQEFYATNGMSSLNSLSTEPPFVSQEIVLSQGWGIYSTYIDPDYSSLDSVFSDVVQYTIICKDANGTIFWPSYGINLIGNMVIGEGYLIKMSSQQTLVVTGSLISPQNNSLFLNVGWDMIAYLRTSPASISGIMSNIVSSVIIVKDGEGNLYWPQYSVNLIGDMHPSKGYQIKMSAQEVLIYDAN